MYVSVPKNYSGNAFSPPAQPTAAQTVYPSCPLPHRPSASTEPPEPEEPPCKPERSERSGRPERSGKSALAGFDAEELLLIGLIALLIGREDCRDLVFMLAILLVA